MIAGFQPNTLEQIVTAELEQASGLRWQNAYMRAAVMIESDVCMHWTGASLLVWSESGELYEAGDENCQCKAFEKGFPCKHRAAYRLVKRLNEVAR